MKVVKSISELRTAIASYKSSGSKIAFVPTMGSLHEGHTSLFRKAKADYDISVASIFVNPLQFNSEKDFQTYPSNLKKDIEIAEQSNVDLLFCPEEFSIYPNEKSTIVKASSLADSLCGRSRPGHFDGVTTVVSILLNLVEPHYALFGEKDFQQLRVIETMVRDLHIPVNIVRCPLIRNSKGLALSSRNSKLSEKGIKSALKLNLALNQTKDSYQTGNQTCSSLILEAKQILNEDPNIEIEYLEVREEENLNIQDIVTSHSRLFVAVKIEGVRLIDNMEL